MENSFIKSEYRTPELEVSVYIPGLICESPSGDTEDFVDNGQFEW